MDIMKNKVSALTADVLAKSAEFATRIQGFLPSILCDVGHYSNDAFLLRSFVSLRTHNEGDELAMTVDIKTQSATEASTTISIETDLCLDDGTIVATGPSAEFETSSRGFETAISSWSKNFDAFLHASEVDVLNVLTEMISQKSKVSSRPNRA
jgi:hypothetical protein